MLPVALISIIFASTASIASAAPVAAPIVSFYPENPIQGQPIAVMVARADDASVRYIMLGPKVLSPFEYDGATWALYGSDIKEKPATSTVLVSFADGRIVRSHIRLNQRPKIEAPFGIPAKLGGNTPAAATTLVNTLEQENKGLLGLETAPQSLWNKPFSYPLKDSIITDDYGYSRSTVGQNITHKGTDFRANETTPVLAMNDGIVRLVQEGRNYGKTVVIDHGLGVQTFYMHLSRIDVAQGEKIRRGNRIGMAGQTGYAEAAHLHLTVRINEVSVDPIVFLGLFK
ncbi:MAG: M23 family metallopeptidase [bacterium]|nr:M23 family metallopeptidase [bacterium]